MLLDKDTFSIVQSYFDIEDILIAYENNLEERDKLIKQYHRVLPTFPELIKNNYLKSLRYAIEERKYYIFDRDLRSAVEYDKLQILEYLSSLIYPDKSFKTFFISYIDKYKFFVYDCVNIYKCMDKELDLVLCPYDDFISAISYSSIKIIEYLLENKDHKLIFLDSDKIRRMILEKDVEFCKKLHNIGYPFTYLDLRLSLYNGNLKISKYFIFLGINPDVDLLNYILPNKNLSSIKILIECGIKPNSTTYRIIKIYNLAEIKKYLETIN